jgi:hypothetical protein
MSVKRYDLLDSGIPLKIKEKTIESTIVFLEKLNKLSQETGVLLYDANMSTSLRVRTSKTTTVDVWVKWNEKIKMYEAAYFVIREGKYCFDLEAYFEQERIDDKKRKKYWEMKKKLWKKEEAEKIPKTFEIWSEGFKLPDQSGGATLHGKSEGATFVEACKNYAKTNSDFDKYFDATDLSFWGCKLFDNETDARVNFG